MAYGGNRKWKVDSTLPDDVVETSTALKYLGRKSRNVLVFAAQTGELTVYSLGYKVGYSLAQLAALKAHREGVAYQTAPSDDVWASRIGTSGLPPDPVPPFEAARLAGVSDSWLRVLRVRGRIHAYDLAGQTVYSAMQARALRARE